MLSLSAKIIKEIVRFSGNVNPYRVEKKKIDVVKNLRSMEMFFKPYIPPMGYTLKKYTVDGLPIEMFHKKEGGNKKLVLVLHGGAYITRLAFIFRWFNKTYSVAAGGASVMQVDYRCFPEFKHPAMIEDALKAWDFALEQGYKPEDIIVVGDSAGGHLTMSLLIRLHEAKRQMPKAAVLLSPWLDMSVSGKSYLENYPVDPVFGQRGKTADVSELDFMKKSIIFGWFGDNDRTDPHISPIYYDFDDTFPPLFISVGGDEVLVSDSETLHEKIQKAGGYSELYVTPGMFHDFNLYRLFPESREMVRKICTFISTYSK